MKSLNLMFLRKSMQGAIELITFFPILLIIAVYLLPGFNTWHWALFFMIYYLSGILVRTALRKRSKLLAGLIGTAISGFLAYIIFGWNPALWLSWPIGTILVLRGVNFVERIRRCFRWSSCGRDAVIFRFIYIFQAHGSIKTLRFLVTRPVLSM